MRIKGVAGLKKKVLVFPCGSVMAVDINFALRNSLRVEVYGASSIEDHGRYIFKNYIGGLPNIAESSFLLELNKILKKYEIDYIIPTHDTVALYLIENDKEISARIICSCLETTKICRHKFLTYDSFKEDDFIPKVYGEIDEVIDFPVFLKPDDGQGGKGTHIANDREELKFYMKRTPSLLICEYLPGEEISVDCFTDRKSKLRFVGSRTRGRIVAGMSVSSKMISVEDEVYKIAETINNKLNFRGYWFFQLKKDKNERYKLLEIATRLAGTSCLSRNLDINFPLLSVLDFDDEDIEIFPNNYEIEVDRILINRYKLGIEYERVYIDFDDTIILNKNKYNQYILMFLYQCLNDNKEIILITKHESCIREEINKLRISVKLFDRIIEVRPDDFKYKYMDNAKRSIFIDNSFAERKLVREYLNIPCFDVSNIECLIDWRG